MTPNDIKAFLAMIVAMGFVNQEYIQDYWSTDEVLSTPFLSQITSRDKFLNILTFFHCVTMTGMFLEDRKALIQNENLALYTVLSLKNFQVFGSQAKISALMRQ